MALHCWVGTAGQAVQPSSGSAKRPFPPAFARQGLDLALPLEIKL